jgi:hypothetical protein
MIGKVLILKSYKWECFFFCVLEDKGEKEDKDEQEKKKEEGRRSR